MKLLEWQNIEKPLNDLIIQASTVLEEEGDGWRHFPIGMSYQFVEFSQLGNNLKIGNHANLVLCAFSPFTDRNRRINNNVNRKKILNNLSDNNIDNIILNPRQYFESLPSYKFVISPEGNGIDCHRHYEALIAGCIPIIEKNPLTEEKYKNMPVLWTIDYSEITHEYLNIKYQEFLDKSYDFSKLFLSGFGLDTQKEIKRCGNYWCKRLLNKQWYT
jgi:hypothetical protein